MRILVLGASGFLGRNCIKSLVKNNTVFAVDRIDFEFEGVEFSKINITDTDMIENYIEEKKIDVIVHFISSLIPSSNLQNYLDDINSIYVPTLKLIEYCSANNIGFVYISSGGAIYGNQEEIFNEHTTKEPDSFYGLSKLNLENAINFYHKKSNLQYLILRPSNPYGHGQNLYGKQGLIAVILGKILKNEPIEIWGDGSNLKDYIYIDDFVFYVDSLINNKASWNNTYNIGSGVGTSINDVLDAFRQNNIELPKIINLESRNFDVKRMILDCTKIQKIVNHKNKTILQGIKLFYDEVK